MGGAEIIIEDQVLFGPYCVVVSSSHTRPYGSFRYGIVLANSLIMCFVGVRLASPGGRYKYRPYKNELNNSTIWRKAPTLYVGFGTWIAAHVTITSGSTIGNGTLVAAGAIVKGNIPSDSLVGGQPAKFLRSLDEPTNH